MVQKEIKKGDTSGKGRV